MTNHKRASDGQHERRDGAREQRQEPGPGQVGGVEGAPLDGQRRQGGRGGRHGRGVVQRDERVEPHARARARGPIPGQQQRRRNGRVQGVEDDGPGAEEEAGGFRVRVRAGRAGDDGEGDAGKDGEGVDGAAERRVVEAEGPGGEEGGDGPGGAEDGREGEAEARQGQVGAGEGGGVGEGGGDDGAEVEAACYLGGAAGVQEVGCPGEELGG